MNSHYVRAAKVRGCIQVAALAFLLVGLQSVHSASPMITHSASADEAVWQDEYDALSQTCAEAREKTGLGRGASASPADYQSLLLPTDRNPLDVVLRRTQALINHLSKMPKGPNLANQASHLARLRTRSMSGLAKGGSADDAARRELFFEACALRKQVAFSNPLLNFDRILFIKFTTARGKQHMCDQYFGVNAGLGGGLFAIENAFSGTPRVVNLLENSVVTNGTTFKGKKLSGGGFLSPDLSYDAKNILFAYSNGLKPYRIFAVGADGADLHELTNGSADDFDPCYLPNGRIVFISTRRGGYGRCHPRCVPTFTLHSMKNDGSDLIPISYHETNEWHPSVNNEGIIAYTRWDYIDRDSDIAHHFWYCYPDGRDPRSNHGNYPLPLFPSSGDGRKNRPWMEMNIRAIPHSQKYILTAAPHHGWAFGSLVLLDPTIPDNGVFSQLRRITPQVPFPESEPLASNVGVYATAWPLSEDFYLCSYSAKNTTSYENRNLVPARLGIFLVDKFGNKDLVYQDAALHCLDPIPFRSRTTPPAIATMTSQGQNHKADSPKATISVMNVYESDFQWPSETRITALRVIQILPKTTCLANEPRVGYGLQTTARLVLGTVPVEKDGSAYFEAPVGKTILFQALDAKGLAVQSMRSGTYVHSGEQLSCTGCHEDKWKAPGGTTMPLALKRQPSKLAADVTGSQPMSFSRLVQPVLTAKCAGCHAKEGKGPNLSGAIATDMTPHWTRAYNNLKPYAFYFHGGGNGSISDALHGGSRTPAGKFGAKASRLIKYLDPSHHSVQLTQEEFHRITLWLDCNSEFLGAYTNTKEQAEGKLVWPSLDVDPANPSGVESGQAVMTDYGSPVTSQRIPGLVMALPFKNGIRVVNHEEEEVFVNIFDLAGRRLAAGNVGARANAAFSVSAKGLHVVRVNRPGGATSCTFTVQRK